MDISKIQHATSIGKIDSNKTIQTISSPQDAISISNEADKIRVWVRLLQEMPDVRPHITETFNVIENSEIYLKVAERLLDSQNDFM